MSAVGERNDFGLTAWDRYRILTSYRTIAMVGLSSNYYNASSFAGVYLDANHNGQQNDSHLHGDCPFKSISRTARPGDACCSPRVGRCYLLFCSAREE